jgi:hypothetical protein
VLAAVALGFVFLSRGEDPKPQPPNVAPTPTEEAGSRATPAPEAPAKDNVLVGVYNGTGATGLAAEFKGQLVQEGYPDGNLGVGNVPPELLRQTSVVMYAEGAKAAAEELAAALDIRDVQRIDQPTQGMIRDAPKDWNVVVIIGADKSQ